MLIRAMIIVGLFIAALGAGDARAERRIALVVGNSAYDNAAVLRNPRNDATDVAEVLRKVGFEVALGLDLDQQHFAQAIERFARALEGADVALFYYAGHGLQMNERNYLVSTNAKLQNEFLLTSETIDLEAIVRLMESKSVVNLVFLDACRNNPLAENLKRSLETTKRAVNLGRGLARIEPSGRDTLIAFAAAPGQVAADGQGRNSPFTGSLLKNINRPGVEVSVMLKEVSADVRRETQNTQRPQQLSDMSRVFYFARAEAPLPAAPPPVPAVSGPIAASDDRTLDIAFWNSAQAANDCEAVRAYLRRFPAGVFVDLAKLSERRLCAPQSTAALNPPATQQRNAPSPAVKAAPPPPPVAAVTPPPAPSVPELAAADPAPVATPPSAPAPAAAPPPAAVAALPSPAAAPEPAPPDLARKIQVELERVGCMSNVTGAWGAPTQAAIKKFNRFAKTSLEADQPSVLTMVALQGQHVRVCPLACKRGFRAEDDECVAIGKPRSRAATTSKPERPERPKRGGDPANSSSAAAAAAKSEFASPNCQSRIQVGTKWCCTFDPPRGPSIVICK